MFNVNVIIPCIKQIKYLPTILLLLVQQSQEKENTMELSKKANKMNMEELARYIDYSILKPQFNEQEIRENILAAINYKCRTVCISGSYIPIARQMCKDTGVDLCVVCDFPFGTASTASKVSQAEDIVKNGNILELDIVSNYGLLRSGKFREFTADIQAVVKLCHDFGTQVKVILETDALTDEEICTGVECCIQAGADFAKTSTGFFNEGREEGASVRVIDLMINQAKGRIKIKGAAKIRTREHFLTLIDMGIDRMGVGFKSVPVVLGLD